MCKICRQSERALKGSYCLWRKASAEVVNVRTSGMQRVELGVSQESVGIQAQKTPRCWLCFRWETPGSCYFKNPNRRQLGVREDRCKTAREHVFAWSESPGTYSVLICHMTL